LCSSSWVIRNPSLSWIIESLFGWDQVREEENFARFFKLDEARIITADGRSVGWIQEQVDDTRINLGSFYVMQGNAAARHWNTGSSDTAGARR
jgi:hypothetical protein